jgi:Helix-turn-helix domain
MAKRRKRGGGIDQRGRSKREGQYFGLPYSMAHSLAFRSLSGGALKVFVELRCRFNGANNGKVFLSYQEAADLLGMSKSTAARAFAELKDKGFIKLACPGHFYGRRAAEWILTDCPLAGHPATRDWQAWRPKRKPKSKTSVPRRHETQACVPDEYRSSELCRQDGTRQPGLRVIDGAAGVLPLPSWEGGEATRINSNTSKADKPPPLKRAGA